MKKETVLDLLSAEWQKSRALLCMQAWIGNGEYEYAMMSQFDYLYWRDECIRLHLKFNDAYWDLRYLASGG